MTFLRMQQEEADWCVCVYVYVSMCVYASVCTHSSHMQVSSCVIPLGMNHSPHKEHSSEFCRGGSGSQGTERQTVSSATFPWEKNISSYFGAAPPTRGSQVSTSERCSGTLRKELLRLQIHRICTEDKSQEAAHEK